LRVHRRLAAAADRPGHQPEGWRALFRHRRPQDPVGPLPRDLRRQRVHGPVHRHEGWRRRNGPNAASWNRITGPPSRSFRRMRRGRPVRPGHAQRRIRPPSGKSWSQLGSKEPRHALRRRVALEIGSPWKPGVKRRSLERGTEASLNALMALARVSSRDQFHRRPSGPAA
jgi:hypothetical protein